MLRRRSSRSRNTLCNTDKMFQRLVSNRVRQMLHESFRRSVFSQFKLLFLLPSLAVTLSLISHTTTELPLHTHANTHTRTHVPHAHLIGTSPTRMRLPHVHLPTHASSPRTPPTRTHTSHARTPGFPGGLYRWEAERVHVEHLVLVRSLRQHEAVLCDEALPEIVRTRSQGEHHVMSACARSGEDYDLPFAQAQHKRLENVSLQECSGREHQKTCACVCARACVCVCACVLYLFSLKKNFIILRN